MSVDVVVTDAELVDRCRRKGVGLPDGDTVVLKVLKAGIEVGPIATGRLEDGWDGRGLALIAIANEATVLIGKMLIDACVHIVLRRALHRLRNKVVSQSRYIRGSP